MAWTTAKNRRVRTLPLALTVETEAERPRTREAFLALLALRSVTDTDRAALLRAWRDGGVVVFVVATRRYATRSGVLSPERMEREFVAALTGTRAILRDLARMLAAGQIGLDEFRRRAAEEIERAHWDAALLLVGPLIFSLPLLLNRLQEMIQAQLGWLDRLVSDLAAGLQRLDGTLLRRIGMYAGSGWSAYEELTRPLAYVDGYREERNILGAAEHCDGCLSETARGWVPIGTLVPIGSRDCLSNCLCSYEFR